MVAEMVQVNVPFNNPVTGFCAFTHKAGIHQKAILNDPSTYEAIAPGDFGISRYIHFGSRLTGWNAIKSRVEQLGLKMSDAEVKVLLVTPCAIVMERWLTQQQDKQDQGYGRYSTARYR